MKINILREIVYKANVDLVKYGLVNWTTGNVSGRDPDSGLVVIKPSGLMFEDLTPENMVTVDLQGKILDADYGASTDTFSHLYIYKNRPDVMGVVHTHSNYATAFAAVGKPIPVYLTTIADEFGGEIPCGKYCRIGSDEVGKEIINTIGKSPAILMKQHGVYTLGATVEKAFKIAVMVEDVAKTVWLAKHIGELETLPQEEIEANFERNQKRYGTFEASSGLSSDIPNLTNKK